MIQKEYANVNELIDFTAVCSEPIEMTEEEILSKFALIQRVKAELELYISELMGAEPYLYEVVLPLGKIKSNSITVGNSGEIIRFPFGMFSINLWEKLLADKDNPVFKVLTYFEFNVKGIKSLLVNQGVNPKQFVTVSLLNKHKITDIFSLHSFINVYDNASDYLS